MPYSEVCELHVFLTVTVNCLDIIHMYAVVITPVLLAFINHRRALRTRVLQL